MLAFYTGDVALTVTTRKENWYTNSSISMKDTIQTWCTKIAVLQIKNRPNQDFLAMINKTDFRHIPMQHHTRMTENTACKQVSSLFEKSGSLLVCNCE